MDESIVNATKRIDMINTQWSLLRRAHTPESTGTEDARRSLVLRYSPAIRRYLGAITRDSDEADELSQEVVVRMLRGDFGGADPDRGRFRDFLKTCIRNMARNFWSRKNRRKTAGVELEALQIDDDAEDPDAWLNAWQNNLLDLAWLELENHQKSHAGSVAYTVLRLRSDDPDASSEELAQRLSEEVGKPVRADTARQQLKRARERFATMLLQCVADGLDNPSADRVQEELIAVGLFEQIRSYLPADGE